MSAVTSGVPCDQVCAYAGTGNVLKVQEMLHICTDHYDTDDSPASKTKDKKDKANKDSKDKEDKKDEATASGSKDKETKETKDEEKDVDLSSQQSIAVLGV